MPPRSGQFSPRGPRAFCTSDCALSCPSTFRCQVSLARKDRSSAWIVAQKKRRLNLPWIIGRALTHPLQIITASKVATSSSFVFKFFNRTIQLSPPSGELSNRTDSTLVLNCNFTYLSQRRSLRARVVYLNILQHIEMPRVIS